jgi:hypothetical protein
MATKFHVIVLQERDEDTNHRLTPRAVLLHARAEHYRIRYRIALLLAVVQIMMAGFSTLLGIAAAPILLGVLAGGLSMAAITGWAAWVTRKDMIE